MVELFILHDWYRGNWVRRYSIPKQIRAQAELAIDEADVIIFLTNGRDGVTSDDEEVAKLLYKTDKPVVLAVNKIDNFDMNHMIYDFYSLGFGDPFPISGSHGLGYRWFTWWSL